MSEITLSKKNLLIDGRDFYLASGDIHYFRIFPGGLKRRLQLMKAFGLTAVQVYVPWNLHEPEKGKFVFDGLGDLEGFLRLCAREDLKVLLRPSPYICSEWDFGGLPHWLQRENCVIRSHDPAFMKHVRDYYQVLCPKFLPYLATKGGPIIAVAVENEYGSYGMDREYLRQLKDLLIQQGVDVPLYTTDGHSAPYLFYGTIDGVWAGVNYRRDSQKAIDSLRGFQKDKPAFIGEYWSGRAIHWGEPYEKRDVEDVAAGYREGLEKGGLLNFYMFTGGTNFGFMNGADYGISYSAPKDTPSRYIPHTTTYDEDALINEQGLPTEKYFACRKVLWEYLKKPEPPMPEISYRAQTVGDIVLDQSLSLWDAVEDAKVEKSILPMTMDQLGQDYGYILYRTKFTGCGAPVKLIIEKLRDRADVFVDRKRIGTLMRGRDSYLQFYVPKNKTVTIEILCENAGRINFGHKMDEKKGIGGVMIQAGPNRQIVDWENISLPFPNLDYAYQPFAPTQSPVFLQGSFDAEPRIDTFLDMRRLKKGFVFVNGFHLGRYWSVGPQYTLYVPGELIRRHNTIQVFEHYGASRVIKLKTRRSALLK